MLRAYALTTIAVLSFFAFSGCADKDAKPIVIGLLAPLTGNGRGSGEMHVKLVSSMVEELNSAGGIDGRKIKLVVEDTASDPAQTLISIKRLLEIHYAYAVLYPFHKGYSPAVPFSFNLGKTPVLIYGSPEIPEEDLNTWMIVIPDAGNEAARDSDAENSLLIVSEENTKKTFNLLVDGVRAASKDKARARKHVKTALENGN